MADRACYHTGCPTIDVLFMAPDDNELLTTTEPPAQGHAPLAAGTFQFTDLGRQTQLDIALHILQASDRVLVVRAAAGMGKSTFLRALQQRQPDGLQIALATAQPQADLQELLAALAPTADIDTPPLEILRDVARAGLRPVLLVDDLDRLNRATLAELLALWVEARSEGLKFGLALAGSMAFDASIATTLEPSQLHLITLQPFSEQQSIDYLTQRLDAAGILTMGLLTPAEMRAIHNQAQGIPARLDQEAQRLLNTRLGTAAESSPTGSRSSRNRSTVLVVAALAILVGALLVALLYTEQQPPIEAPPIAAALSSHAAVPVTTGHGRPGVTPPAADSHEPATEPAPIELPPMPVVAEPVPVATPAQQQPPPAPAAQTPPPQPAPASGSTAAKPAVERNQPLGNAWLRSRQPNRYTIQLIAATDAAPLRNYLREHGLTHRAALLSVNRNGRPWHVVVLGDYPDRSSARAALERLPQVLRSDGAWVRDFGELQRLARR